MVVVAHVAALNATLTHANVACEQVLYVTQRWGWDCFPHKEPTSERVLRSCEVTY